MIWVVRILAIVLIAVTLLPFVSTRKWWVRGWEIPRSQIAAILLVPILLAVWQMASSGFSSELIFWLSACVSALTWQILQIIPLSPLWTKEINDVAAEAGVFKLLAVNLKVNNRSCAVAQREIANENADVLLLVEPDEKWSQELRHLREQYSFHHDEFRDDGLGMALWSKFKISDLQTRYIVTDRRPSIWAQVEVPDGQSANLVCIHPTPPGLDDDTGESRRDSGVRDAELVLIAQDIAEHRDKSWMVAGDFNDAAWSRTMKLFKRLSRLKDPRVGRAVMGTFHAKFPLLRFPLDHVFLSQGYAIGELRRVKIAGSDHFGVVVKLALQANGNGVDPKPKNSDVKKANRLVKEGISDAADRDVKSEKKTRQKPLKPEANR